MAVTGILRRPELGKHHCKAYSRDLGLVPFLIVAPIGDKCGIDRRGEQFPMALFAVAQ
jgi:hypothetical protein